MKMHSSKNKAGAVPYLQVIKQRNIFQKKTTEVQNCVEQYPSADESAQYQHIKAAI